MLLNLCTIILPFLLSCTNRGCANLPRMSMRAYGSIKRKKESSAWGRQQDILPIFQKSSFFQCPIQVCTNFLPTREYTSFRRKNVVCRMILIFDLVFVKSPFWLIVRIWVSSQQLLHFVDHWMTFSELRDVWSYLIQSNDKRIIYACYSDVTFTD